MKLQIIKHKNFFILLSAIFVGLSITSLIYFGLRPGIDFKSGSSWLISVPATEKELSDYIKDDLKIEDAIISYDSASDSYSIVMSLMEDEDKAKYAESLKEKFGDFKELDFGLTTPSVSNELKNKSIILIISVLVIMAIYITFAFRMVSYPVSSWRYGIITIIALMHDVVIAAGVMAAIGYFKGITIDTNFVIALLTIAGFSAQDTIVVFDRIREKLSNHKEKGINMAEIVNNSLNEVVMRSVNTSISIMLVLLAIAVFGPISVRYFAIVMLTGMFFGTYSSIFLASPLLVLSHELDTKRKKL